MNPLDLPAHIWSWASAVIVAATAAVSAFVTSAVASRRNRADGLSALIDQLQEEVQRLAARVEALERHRDAYRDWSIVLWEWGGDVHSPENPRPTWPDDLPR